MAERASQSRLLKTTITYLHPLSKRGRQDGTTKDDLTEAERTHLSRKVRDIELNPVHSFQNDTSYVGTCSRSSIPESGPWDDIENFRHQDHIFVRSDLSVE